MDTETVTLFLALLAVGAEVAVVVTAVVVTGALVSSRLASFRDRALAVVGPQALGLGLLVATIATAGSLYFSEVANFVPCTLCWYQRIAMYPLVPVLAVAAWRRDLEVRATVLVLAGVGGAISTYHVLLERGVVHESGVCEATNPCTVVWVERLGYLTIPMMALSAFALIVTLALVARHDDAEPDDHDVTGGAPVLVGAGRSQKEST